MPKINSIKIKPKTKINFKNDCETNFENDCNTLNNDKTKHIFQDDITNINNSIINELDQKIEESKHYNNTNTNTQLPKKNNFNYSEDTFDVIDTILTQNDKKELVNHQYLSYKQFIEKDIGDIIQQFNTRKIYFNYNSNANKHKIELHIDFLNYNLSKPTIHENDGSFKVMRPDIAKLRNLTYSAPLTLNISEL